jgi:GNAT superfamily N-acetyltransferase
MSCFIRTGDVHDLPVAVAIDDDAWTAFLELDPRFSIELSDDHPYLQIERGRWAKAALSGNLLLAWTADHPAVGFAVLGVLDGVPHLHQVSVRRAWSRRGVGSRLVQRAIHWSAPAGELWLTTYDHVPWNRAWYEQLGFVTAAYADCGVETRAVLDLERSTLPDPEHRVAMVHRAGERCSGM